MTYGQGQAVISVGMTESDTVWPAFPATKSWLIS